MHATTIKHLLLMPSYDVPIQFLSDQFVQLGFSSFCPANAKVTCGALGLAGESPGVTVFHFILRR